MTTESPAGSFSERLAERIERAQLTQSALADQSGLSQSMISRLVSGDRTPTMTQLVALARVLGCLPGALVQDTTEAGVLEEWVSSEQYQESERTRLRLEGELDEQRARNRALEGERDSLNTLIRNRQEEAAALERRAIHAEAALEGERQARAEVQRDLSALRSNYHELQVKLEEATAKLVTLGRQVQQLKEGAAVSTVVGTAIGAILGGLAASSRR